MIVQLGNFLFRFRNGLFPLAYVILFLPSPPLLGNEYVALGLGLAIASFGQLLRAITIGLVYIRRGGKNRQVYAKTLVQDGVFAHCRNPLYVGNFLILVGLGFVANSALFFILGIPFFLVAYWAIIAAEENFLQNKFGDEFRAYCARVNRILPDLRGFGETWAMHTFKWRRLIVKEYGTPFIWMTGAILLIEKNLLFSHAYTPDVRFHYLMLVLFLIIVTAFALARTLKKREILVAD